MARSLGRSLVIDWRGFPQLADPALDYFTEFFQRPGTILGVEVAHAPTGEDYEPESGAAWLEPAEALAIARGERDDVPVPIVLQPYHGVERFVDDRVAVDAFLHAFYGSIELRPELRRAADEWWEQNVSSPVVAVNVRTGNGHYFGSGQRYEGRVDVSLFEDEERFLGLLRDACATVAPPGAAVLVATDSVAMSELLMQLPRAVTRRNVFPPPGSGDQHRFPATGSYTDRDAIRDTLVDMVLLARADALVCNFSMFNQLARATTRDFGGRCLNFEALARC